MEFRTINKKGPYNKKTIKWLENVYSGSELYPDIDPFHRVYRFTDHVYSIYEECAAGGSDLWINLIEGETAALLIDTGYGIGELPKLIRHLIGDKPLYVVNTHEHYDHVLGNCRFQRVYCHMLAVPEITKNYMIETAHAPYMDQNGNGIYLNFTKTDVPEYRGYELVPCVEGDVFDLGGGNEIVVIHTPGHAAGGISLLDRKNRILFTGAMHSGNTVIAGNQDLYRKYNTVESFLVALERLRDTCFDAFDRIFPAHEIPVLDKSYILDEIQVCKDVIENHTLSENEVIEKNGCVQYCHMVGDAGIRYYKSSFLNSNTLNQNT